MSMEEKSTIIVKCDNCGNPFDIEKPEFGSEYEMASWLNQSKLCEECSHLAAKPDEIKQMVHTDPKGYKWNATDHGKGYLSNEVSPKRLEELEKKEKEIRKANVEVTKRRLKAEFG